MVVVMKMVVVMMHLSIRLLSYVFKLARALTWILILVASGASHSVWTRAFWRKIGHVLPQCRSRCEVSQGEASSSK